MNGIRGEVWLNILNEHVRDELDLTGKSSFAGTDALNDEVNSLALRECKNMV